MSAVLVDSNVLFDILTEDRRWQSWSSAALRRGADDGRLVINPIIYGELCVGFATIEEADEALPPSVFEREPVPYDAAFLAAKAYAAYRKKAGTRTSLLPDFYIGAHAAVSGYRLLTRDVARYRTYFPKLTLIAPMH
jgi:predicted nucleic acid-binding protein